MDAGPGLFACRAPVSAGDHPVLPDQSGKDHRFTGPPRARKVGEMLYFDGDSSGHDLLLRISEYTRLGRSMADLVARVPCPPD